MTDLARRFGPGDVVHTEAGGVVDAALAEGVVARLFDRLLDRLRVVAFFVSECFGSVEVELVDDEEQILVRLKMDIPVFSERRYERDRLWIFRVAHIQHRKATGKDVGNVGVAARGDLNAVGASTLVRPRNEIDVLTENRAGSGRHDRGGYTPQIMRYWSR